MTDKKKGFSFLNLVLFVLFLAVVPAAALFLDNDKYQVFNGLTKFLSSYTAAAAVLLFSFAAFLRVVRRKLPAELLRGAAAGAGAFFALYLLSGITGSSFLSRYLPLCALFLAYLYLEKIYGLPEFIVQKGGSFIPKPIKAVLFWVFTAFAAVVMPFIIASAAKNNYESARFMESGYIWPALGVLALILIWRKYVLKKPADLLRTAGMAVFTYFIFGAVKQLFGAKVPFGVYAYNYLAAVAALYAAAYEKQLAGLAEKAAAKLAPKFSKYLKKAGEAAAKAAGDTAQKAKKIKNKKIIVLAALLVIAASMGIYKAAVYFYESAFVTVRALSPSGEVGGSILITAEFSGPVGLKVKDINSLKCFTITPPLKGTYSFQNKRTVIFTPDEALKPSTRYLVEMNTKDYFTAAGKSVLGAPKTQFNTPLIKVTNHRIFASMDIIKNVEKEVIAELAFNYPVEYDALKAALSVSNVVAPNCTGISKKENPADFKLEKSETNTRYYIKVPGIKRSYDCQSIKISVSKNLKCPECTDSMASDFSAALAIPQRQRLYVESVQPWHSEGDTSVAVRFNMPINASDVKRHLTVIRRATVNSPQAVLPVEIKTEYCYAVLEGKFEPNLVYEVSVSKDLTSKTGEIMSSDYKSTVQVKDLPSTFDFAEQGEILSPSGSLNAAVKVMNLDKINVKVYKIFKNNLVYYLRYRNTYDYGQEIFNSEHRIKGGEINREVMEYINFEKMNNEPYKGIFYVEVSDPKSYWNRKGKIVRCTDIGLFARESGKDLIVKAVSINSLNPVESASLKLYSTSNQVMKEIKTDAEGRAVFANWRSGNTYNFSPYMLLAERGEDFSYITFGDTTLNNYSFDTGGESLPERIRAFVTSDRGLYRPGEKVNITAILRNPDNTPSSGIIAEAVITGPSGQHVTALRKETNREGMEVFSHGFPLSAQTGEYSVAVRIPAGDTYEAGRASFKIEEFIPDKLTVKITPDTPYVPAGSPILFSVNANQMFGPPAAGNRLETEVKFTDYNFQSAKYKGYVFRDPSRQYAQRSERLGSDNLDAAGEKRYSVAIPEGVKPPSALLAEVYSEVYDDGGRPVGGVTSVPVYIYDYYLGVKLKEDRKIYRKGDKVEVQIAAVSSDDKNVNLKDVEVIVKRKVWYSIFRRTSWSHDMYNSASYNETVVHKLTDINGTASLVFDADIEGEYQIFVGNEERMRTGLTVNVAGTGFTTYDITNADRLSIKTDKETYNAGDRAVIKIKAPFDGKLYVALEREKVMFERYITLENGEAVVEIPIEAQYLPNVYFTAVAIRKPLEKYATLPFAAYGIENIKIDRSAKAMKAELKMESEVMSTKGINAYITGLVPGSAAVLAAVDEGILQIIRFETPDPLGFFFRKRSLQTQTHTIFKKLLTDVKAAKLAVGGGEDMGPMGRHLNPIIAKNVESYAKFSGILYADETGAIMHQFDTKNFNGKVRVMAFAAKGDRFASVSKQVNVVDPIVITPTLPRFLAPDDEFYMAVRVYNNTPSGSEFEVSVKTEGPVSFEEGTQKAQIDSKGEKIFTFRGRAKKAAGKTIFTISASGSGESLFVKRELAVRPAAHMETIVKRGKMEDGKEISFDVPEGYIPQGKRARLVLTTSRAAEYAGAFDYLINYPYGCLEQTLSAGFPLLYFKELSITQMLMETRALSVDYYIGETIKRLDKFILPGGNITFWPGSSYPASDWLKLYAANFVIEAKAKGYFVEPRVYDAYIAAAGLKEGTPPPQENYADEDYGEEFYDEETGESYERSAPENSSSDEEPSRLDRRSVNAQAYNYENNIYRLYLKALLETPDKNTMKYYEDLYAINTHRDKKASAAMKNFGYSLDRIKILEDSMERDYMLKGGLLYKTASDFVNGLAETDKFLLSMSYSSFNNSEAARMVLFEDFKSKYMIRELNGFFNSYSRNLGIYLAALSLAEGKVSSRVEYNENLLLKEVRSDGSFGSTQETSWALRGLAEAAKLRGEEGKLETEIFINGETAGLTKGASYVINDKAGKWKNVKASAKGEGVRYYSFYLEGTPLEKNKKPVSKGLKIYRKYFDEEGKEANLSSVEQGKLLVVSVTIEPQSNRPLDNVVVVDMLPAGFEIENPRLKTRGRLKFTPVSNFNAAYEDIRDDRMLLFTGALNSPMTFSYTVRAVTPGKYIIPNAYAEAMYDPDVKAESYEGDYLIVAPVVKK